MPNITFEQFERAYVKHFGQCKTKPQLTLFFNFAASLGLKKVHKTKTYWNGEPCEAITGYGVIEDSPEFPAFWARDLVGQSRKVVMVLQDGEAFFIDNEDGSGWRKITEGRGSPTYGHRSLTVRDFESDLSREPHGKG